MNDSVLYAPDLFGASSAPKASGPVAERFLIPPFTILDAKQGDWLERKRAWLSVGIKSEVGRGESLTFNTTNLDHVSQEMAAMGGTSLFDPVVCELAYRWFCPSGGQIVDPFAGGSVRGIVASMLGFDYWGCDLRSVQIDANRQQADELCTDKVPTWVCGDSMDEVETDRKSVV